LIAFLLAQVAYSLRRLRRMPGAGPEGPTISSGWSDRCRWCWVVPLLVIRAHGPGAGMGSSGAMECSPATGIPVLGLYATLVLGGMRRLIGYCRYDRELPVVGVRWWSR
jgi:hypothetical protein